MSMLPLYNTSHEQGLRQQSYFWHLPRPFPCGQHWRGLCHSNDGRGRPVQLPVHGRARVVRDESSPTPLGVAANIRSCRTANVDGYIFTSCAVRDAPFCPAAPARTAYYQRLPISLPDLYSAERKDNPLAFII